MDGKGEATPLFWMEEHNGQLFPPLSMKRKVRSKRLEFVGWGSKQLIQFLESIGKDTSNQISHYDVTDIVNKYVHENNLINPVKKKRIICDERLHSLFGRKTISRIKIHEMLEPHFAENQDESDDDFLCSSEEEQQKSLSLERKTHCKKKVVQTPKSCFAAIVPDNIKLVYLKRSLVQDLLKEPNTFQGKVVGSFVRIKSDPNDYLQENPHQLVQVTGLTKAPGTDDILLQVSNFIKEIRISMLSDDNFSQEECEDLRRRVKDSLLKRPTVVELEEKAQTLHEDVTKHWLAGELALLQKLIDRANEKGWRKELFEYLERRQLLQTPDEQSRLLLEVPEVIADELELEAAPQEVPDNTEQEKNGSAISTLQGASEIPTCNRAANVTLPTWMSFGKDSEGTQAALKMSKHNQLDDMCDALVHKELKQRAEIMSENIGESGPVNVEKNNGSLGMLGREVIDLSDDEEKEDSSGGNQIHVDDVESWMWHYTDPQGNIQGPFSLTSLKRWKDADYFPPDFKVWKTGQSQDQAVLLSDIVNQMFPC